MTVNSNSLALRIIVGAYCLLYFLGFILQFFLGDSLTEGMTRAELYTVPLAFLIFFAGTIMMFFNEKTAGMVILFWHFMTWFFALFLWPDAGMVLVLIFPMIFTAVAMIRNWYKANEHPKWLDRPSQLKMSLRLYIINYAAVYFLVVLSDLLPRLFNLDLPTRVDDLALWDFSSTLGLLLILAFVVFILGLYFSWRSVLGAGISFILWYGLIALLTLIYPAFSGSGPWIVFGLVILVQGIMYIRIYREDRRRALS